MSAAKWACKSRVLIHDKNANVNDKSINIAVQTINQPAVMTILIAVLVMQPDC